MPRNYIQKRITQTEVVGYMIEDDKPVKVSFTVPIRCKTLTGAQGLIRKQYPTFAATELQHTARLYKMSVDDFMQLATLVEEEGQDNE